MVVTYKVQTRKWTVILKFLFASLEHVVDGLNLLVSNTSSYLLFIWYKRLVDYLPCRKRPLGERLHVADGRRHETIVVFPAERVLLQLVGRTEQSPVEIVPVGSREIDTHVE